MVAAWFCNVSLTFAGSRSYHSNNLAGSLGFCSSPVLGQQAARAEPLRHEPPNFALNVGNLPAGAYTPSTTKGSDVQRLNIGIFGSMNAGKSTLMNRITRSETSIVDATPGTTADTKVG